ncbi:MAG: ATP-binding protein [Bacteroidales bacterium]|nr:ATP-binding protein [Bacteroidales bacterium]
MIVFITGSESTGKTKLAQELAEYYSATWVPEYARQYVESLSGDYHIKDVEEIARRQIQEIISHLNDPLVFFDTGLIITKVWFEKKFRNVPEWFDKLYRDFSEGHYLLCSPDLPWIADPLRENPDIREELNRAYEDHIKDINCPFKRISGQGAERKNSAISAVEEWLRIENKKS